MSLEEKIILLSPHHRIQVEEYIDFLLSRSPEIFREEGLSVQGEEVNDDSSAGETHSTPLISPTPSSPNQVRVRTSSSGIILAEERVQPHDNSDYVDFADINSRFGHIPKEEDEQRGPGRLRRFLDWM